MGVDCIYLSIAKLTVFQLILCLISSPFSHSCSSSSAPSSSSLPFSPQAAEANKNATNLLKELDLEKNQEEHRKIAAAKKREKKKQKRKQKKQQEKPEEREDGGDGASEREDDDDDNDDRDEDDVIEEIGASRLSSLVYTT